MNPPNSVHMEGMFLERVDVKRIEVSRRLDHSRRRELGQFFTPSPVGRLIAGMFGPFPRDIHLLDPGAGVGVLTAAFVGEACHRRHRPEKIKATLYEVDPALYDSLGATMAMTSEHAAKHDIDFQWKLVTESFLQSESVGTDLFPTETSSFTHAILNPPYRKMNSGSAERRLVSAAGLETTNLYTAFVFLAGRLLGPRGELVAITPRSFCNGAYFLPFRAYLAREMAFRRVHVFNARDVAFGEDEVLQENVIFALTKAGAKGKVIVSSSEHAEDPGTVREIDHDELIRPDDPDLFLRIALDDNETRVADLMTGVSSTLQELGISVSTGRVVDFRATGFLRKEHGQGTVALLYPGHLRDGGVRWPTQDFKKFNAIAVENGSIDLLVPKGCYVLVKRFSAKEERRRVVASVLLPEDVPGKLVGIENHINFFHRGGEGLDRDLALGLAVYLNSTVVDRFFRQFSGHTQVNAADLRSLRYPDVEKLRGIGKQLATVALDQSKIDETINQEVLNMANGPDPFKGQTRIDEALSILTELGLPREQRNERSALTLLALLDLTPKKNWSDAQAPLRGITEMMGFFKEHYGKEYAPNTRETVRRFTMHQFISAGLAVENPDEPTRPTNSPKWCYQITPLLLPVLRQHGESGWGKAIKAHLATVETLIARYAKERDAQRLPVVLSPGETIHLSPGGQNVLIKSIIEAFCPVFTPGARVVYVGDSADKWGYFNKELLKSLGVVVESHGKMPDVVVHYEAKGWLVLVEAVTSHGPVNSKRHEELKALFSKSKSGLVFVSAFPARKTLLKYLKDISWETEVWCADAPDHLIHFNGERFLGPYPE